MEAIRQNIEYNTVRVTDEAKEIREKAGIQSLFNTLDVHLSYVRLGFTFHFIYFLETIRSKLNCTLSATYVLF